MTSNRERSVQMGVESDLRVEEVRQREKELTALKQKETKKEIELAEIRYEIEGQRLRLNRSLGEFYPLPLAAQMMQTDLKMVAKMVKNGRLFGMKVNGKWYVEKDDVDHETELTV